jgi:hypothetical protein
MTTEQFDRILESRIKSIKQVLGNKAKEYAIGDRLYNFKRAAEISRTTPQKALAGMFMKHLVSVLDLVEGSISPSENMVNEKIGDAINYLILLETVLKEPVVNPWYNNKPKKQSKGAGHGKRRNVAKQAV